MPNPPTTYMLLVLPTEDADPEVWAQFLNDALGGANGVDAHDHTPGRGRQVRSAGIDIDAALVFNDQRGTEISGLAFTALPALLSAGAQEFFVFDGNAYYRNNAGVNVRITNGNTLDVTSVGGIGGDYAAISAEVAYVDASDSYTFKQQLAAAVRQWARVACAGVDLYEYKAAGLTPAPVNRVRLSSPAGLAASYEMQMPPSLPGSTQLVQLAASGQVTASNAIANPVTFSAIATFAAAPVLAAGATASAGQTVESPNFKATTAYKYTFSQPFVFFPIPTVFAAGAFLTALDVTRLDLGTSTLPMTIPFNGLPAVGEITSVIVRLTKGSAAGSVTASLRLQQGVGGAILDTDSLSGSPGAGQTITLTSPSAILTSGRAFYVVITGGGTTGDTIDMVVVNVSNP